MDTNERLIHLQAIAETIKKLIDLCAQTSAPAPEEMQFLCTAMANAAGMLTAAGNSLHALIHGPIVCEGVMTINYTERNWFNLLSSIHRAYVANMHIATERALHEICEHFGIVPVSGRAIQAQKICDKLGIDSTSSNGKKILKLAGTNLSFDDYLDAVMPKSKITIENQTTWRNYLKAFNVVRHKISHSNPSLNEKEKEQLNQNGFSQFIKDGILVMNVNLYWLIAHNLLSFIQEIGLNVPSKS